MNETIELTIELPERLYRRATTFAAQEGKTFRSLVVDALEAELARSDAGSVASKKPYWANRNLLPAFDRYRRVGAYGNGADSTETLSDDRDQR